MSRIRSLLILLTIGVIALTACRTEAPTAAPAAVTAAVPAVAASVEVHPTIAEYVAAVEAAQNAQLAAFYQAVAFNAWVDGVRSQIQLDPTLTCIRHRESDRTTHPYTRGYGISTGNGYYGAYQFSAGTWRNTAIHAGRPDLAGLLPHQAAWYDQDAMAKHLMDWQGLGPWGGSCRGY